MDIRKVKKLIELVESSSVMEIEISDGQEQIRISRAANAPTIPLAPSAIATEYSSVSMPTTDDFESDKVNEELYTGKQIRSPMVGIFYGASSPNNPDFVKVGDRVEVGDVLCIIEAMKVMNQIVAEESGIITKVLVENAQPVEYDEPLFNIE